MDLLDFRLIALALAAVALVACGDSSASEIDLEPPAEDEGFQIVENEFMVLPNEDVQYCERFAAPARYAGKPIYVVGVESNLPPATHHFFMGHTAAAGLGPGACLSLIHI